MFDKQTTFQLIGDVQSLDKVAACAAGVNYQELMTNVPKDGDYLIAVVRAVSAGEFWGPNSNHDYFEEQVLIDTHETFLTAHVFKNHDNKDVANAIGPVFKAVYDTVAHCVVLVVGIDRAIAPTIARGVSKGHITDVSMGCRVSHVKCPICDKIAYKPAERCEHLTSHKGHIIDGKVVYELNYGCKFHDISFVLNGADTTAKTALLWQEKCASAAPQMLPRLAADVKSAAFDKEIELPTVTPPVVDVALRAHVADQEDRIGDNVLNKAMHREPVNDRVIEAVRNRLDTVFDRDDPGRLPAVCLVIHSSGAMLTPRETNGLMGMPFSMDRVFPTPQFASNYWFRPDTRLLERILPEPVTSRLIMIRSALPMSVCPDWAEEVPHVPVRMLSAVREALAPLFSLLGSARSVSWDEAKPAWGLSDDQGVYGVYTTTIPAGTQGLPDTDEDVEKKPEDADEKSASIGNAGYHLGWRAAATLPIFALSAAARKREELGKPLGPVERALAYNPGMAAMMNLIAGGKLAGGAAYLLGRKLPSVVRGRYNRIHAWSHGTPWEDTANLINHSGRLIQQTVKAASTDRDMFYTDVYEKTAEGGVDTGARLLGERGLTSRDMETWLLDYGNKVAMALLPSMLSNAAFSMASGGRDPLRALKSIPDTVAFLGAFSLGTAALTKGLAALASKKNKPNVPQPNQSMPYISD